MFRADFARTSAFLRHFTYALDNQTHLKSFFVPMEGKLRGSAVNNAARRASATRLEYHTLGHSGRFWREKCTTETQSNMRLLADYAKRLERRLGRWTRLRRHRQGLSSVKTEIDAHPGAVQLIPVTLPGLDVRRSCFCFGTLGGCGNPPLKGGRRVRESFLLVHHLFPPETLPLHCCA